MRIKVNVGAIKDRLFFENFYYQDFLVQKVGEDEVEIIYDKWIAVIPTSKNIYLPPSSNIIKQMKLEINKKKRN